jgi:hypothetical protein
VEFIYAREYLEAGSVVIVSCDTQINVRVMDDANFGWFKNDQGYRCLGGQMMASPVKIAVPTSGFWNVVLDTAGVPANFRYDINYLKPPG